MSRHAAMLLIALFAAGTRGRSAEWQAPGARARVPLRVHTGFHPRKDEVVEVPLDLLPPGHVRVFTDREQPTFRDESAGVLRFLLLGQAPAYGDVRAMAYVGGSRPPSADARLARPRAQSLVPNGGFEQQLTGWSVPEGRGVTAKGVRDQAHSGDQSLRLDFEGRSGDIVSAKFPVTPHTLLVLRAWARVTFFERPKPHIGSPLRVLVEFYDAEGSLVDRFSAGWSLRSVTTGWQLMHGWRRVPRSARSGQVHIRNWWCQSAAYLDDVEVALFQPPPCEVTVGKAETR